MSTTSSTHFAAALTLMVVLLSGLLEFAGAAEYRATFCGDIIMGYVLLGERLETEGWLWSFEDKIFLKPNQPSAMAPLTIDVGTLSGETVESAGLWRRKFGSNPINLERRTWT